MVDYDQYKYHSCSITNGKCCDNTCRDCELAINYIHTNKIKDEIAELERYTKFERESNSLGNKVMVNVANVIAKTDLDSLKQLQDTTVIFRKNVIAYHPDNLKQYAEHLRKLRRYNNLGIPDMIWGAKNYPAAFLFGDVVYLIAPKIESE